MAQNYDLFPEDRYVIDTSSLVDVQYEDQPTRAWEGIFQLIGNGKLYTVNYVYKELNDIQKLPPEIYHRLLELKPTFCLPDDDLITEAGRIVHSNPQISDWRSSNNAADPWVIAAGKIKMWTVVTQENDIGPKKNRKIPWVCDRENIKWMRLNRLLLKEGFAE